MLISAWSARSIIFTKGPPLTLKSILFVGAVLVAVGVAVPATSVTVQAKGCIKGMIVGGVAGHLAGHGVVGALGGCVAGHEMAKAAAKKKLEEQRQNRVAPVLAPNGQPM